MLSYISEAFLRIKIIEKIFALFAVYFITALLGLSLEAVNNFAALIWLPSGISLAVLLIFGFKLWPGIVLGAFLANFLNGAPFFSALGISLGNTLEPLIAAVILRKFFDFRNSLDRLKDVLGLIIFGALLCTMISATFGVASLYLGGVINTANLTTTWMAWWVGDSISNLVIAPLILVWSEKWQTRQKLVSLENNINIGKLIETFIIAIFLIFVYLVVFRHFLYSLIGSRSLAYMIFPPLIWITLRFGQPGAVLVIFISSAVAVINTLQGQGVFTKGATSEDLLFLQLFMAIISITTLIIAAVVSERKQLEKNKDEFIRIAAHELKTPITTLKGFTQLLQQHLKSKKDQKLEVFVSKMDTQIDNLTRLISDFFDVSKISAGKLDLQKELFEMDALVREVVGNMQQFNHEITIVGSTKRKVLADRYRIAQVLVNLFINAVKFSPKVPKINIILSSNKDSVSVCVQDFGIGISDKDLEKVFDQFFQADTKIRPSMAGMGLGLYISSEIVKRHGGRIWVESKKGKGSTFSFSLPS